MARSLPSVEMVRTYIDADFDRHTPVRMLRWEETPEQACQLWELPEGMGVVGNAPYRLGVVVRRQANDAYSVRLLWDRTQLTWPSLSRGELLASCLAPILAALGVDLWALLEHPQQNLRLQPQAA